MHRLLHTAAQVKNKMTLDAFRRNLRGTNGGADFPAEFLEDIFTSIVAAPLRMSDGSSAYVSPSSWVQLAQVRWGGGTQPSHLQGS